MVVSSSVAPAVRLGGPGTMRRGAGCQRAATDAVQMDCHMLASRQLLVALVFALVVGLAATGYALYQEKKQPEGVEISVGKNGLSIKEK
jgi:hypothetical protein